MSGAARKARKREQRATGERYQHPTREGVPYGRSAPPSYRLRPVDVQEVAMQLEVGRELWSSMSARRGI